MGPRVEVVGDLTSGLGPGFSEDGSHFLLEGRDDDRSWLSYDGKILGRHTWFHRVVIAPDGSFVTYGAGDADTHRNVVVHRGTTTEVPNQVTELAVTPDGAHIAYAYPTKNGEDSAVVLDGTTLAGGRHPRMLTLSRDGKRIGWETTEAKDGTTKSVRIDGERGQVYRGTSNMTFSDDGRHVAHIALLGANGDTAAVVVDGRRGKASPKIRSTLRFTTAGQIVYEIRRKEGAFVVIGAKEHGPYRYVMNLAVARDTVAWGADSLENQRIVARVLIDGHEAWKSDVGRYSIMDDRAPSVSSLAIASDNAVAFGSNGMVTLVDAVGARPIGLGEALSFSEDGKRLATLVHENGALRIVVAGRDGRALTKDEPRLLEIFTATVRVHADHVSYFAKHLRSGGADLIRVEQML